MTAVMKAMEEDGSPSPTDLESRSIELRLTPKLDAQTLRDFLSGKTFLPSWPFFESLVKCLGAEQDEDWKALYEEVRRERNHQRVQKRQANAQKKLSRPKSTPARGGQADCAHAKTAVGGQATDVRDGEEKTPTAPQIDIGDRDATAAAASGSGPQPAAPLLPKRRLSRGLRTDTLHPTQRAGPLTRRRIRVPTGVVIILAALVATNALTHHATKPLTNELASFEASINGSMAGQVMPLAHSVGLWSQPSLSCDYPQVSPCIPGSMQRDKVTLPATVKVTCVKIGQKIRNGAPGRPGYYEDDRWLRTATSTNSQGATYVSNVWFARENLPANLAECSTNYFDLKK